MEAGDSIGMWFFEAVAHGLSTALEAMAGEKMTLQWEPLGIGLPKRNAEDLIWRQSFHGLAGTVWVGTSVASYTGLGRHILQAAGLEGRDEPAFRTTYLELIGRAMASLADQFAARARRNVARGHGEETNDELLAVRAILVRVPLPGNFQAEILAGADQELADALADLLTRIHRLASLTKRPD